MLETIVTVAVVAFVLLMCGVSLYRTFTGKGKSCASCCGNGSCGTKQADCEALKKELNNKP